MRFDLHLKLFGDLRFPDKRVEHIVLLNELSADGDIVYIRNIAISITV
jgi:hypothetical protein